MIALENSFAPPPSRTSARPWWTRRGDHGQLERLRSHQGKRLLFIAGCARSGTSLLRRLMPCFVETAVAPREAKLAHFLSMAADPAAMLVLKRTDRCHRRLSSLPGCVELVYCVRHPYDVLTSSHPETRHLRPFHVTRHRWMDEFGALESLLRRQPERRVTFVRYEDLVADPDKVQASIAESLGLGIMRRFSANPAGIAVHAASVEKWRRDPAIARAIAAFDRGWHARIGEFCDRFGYGQPELAPGRPRRPSPADANGS